MLYKDNFRGYRRYIEDKKSYRGENVREWDPDEWIREFEKRQRKGKRTELPPKALRRIMEGRPRPGKGGLRPGEKEEDI